MRRARGYAPLSTSPEQDAVLRRILDHAARAGVGALAVFDLDGCLFDTRWRQIHVLRELGSRRGWPQLYGLMPEHVLDWDLRASILRSGVAEGWLAPRYAEIRAHWLERFFAGDAVAFDHAMPGAAALVSTVAARGLGVVYLSGRHEGNRVPTWAALERFGFPVESTRLVLQPGHQTDYTTYKAGALDQIGGWGRPVLLMDNEPANVNLFRDRFPNALVVFVETDHSDAPVEPRADIPWIRGFLATAGG